MYRYLIILFQLLIASSIFCAKAQDLVNYRYWFDNEYSGMIVKSAGGSEVDVKHDIDVSGLSRGIHFLNFIAEDADGALSAPFRYLFFIPDITPEPNSVAYSEYWLDDDYIHKTILSGEEASFSLDLSLLTPGIHLLNVVSCSDTGEVSAPYRYLFFVPEYIEEGSVVSYSEYWLDDNYDAKVRLDGSTETSFTINLDGVPQGIHLLNVVSCNEFGAMSAPYRYLFYVPDASCKDDYKLVGYEYAFNGVSTFVELSSPCAEYELSEATIPTPNGSEVLIINKDTDFKISDSKISVSGSIDVNFYLRFLNNGNEWSHPVIYDYTDEVSVEKEAVKIPLMQSTELPIVPQHDFIAITFDIAETDSYQLSSSIPCEVILFDSTGKRLAYIPSESMLSTYQSQLEAGTYYGVIFNTIKDEADTSDTFQLRLASKFVPTPVISYDNQTVSITCSQKEAQIFYSIDGSTPSIPYKDPFSLTHNADIQAIAKAEGYGDSKTAIKTVDWYVAEKPHLSMTEDMLTITCPTEGRKIYYEIGGQNPTKSSPVYENPIRLTDNREVRAYAVAEGFNDSSVESIIPTYFKCAEPQIEFDGRAIKLTSYTDDAEIYFTVDGSEPKERYEDLFTTSTILPGICTVKAFAAKKYFNNSTTLTFSVPCYYNGEDVIIETAGTMHQAFQWCGGDPGCDSLTVTGNINESDIATIRGLSGVVHLDLSKTNISRMPAKAFEGMDLLTLKVPSNKFTAGQKMLAGCPRLAAVVWNSMTEIPSDVFGDDTFPNMLLYVKYPTVVSADFRNVIINGVADEIILEDSKTSNFYCPEEFTAKRISYSHVYSQTTGNEKCMGWESIALPFSPTSITHEKRGLLAPFAANESGKKPFWLCELKSTGFESSPRIESNTPYIIAMPNNDRYSDEYILAGKVTFSGKDVKVLQSDNLKFGIKEDNHFVPNLQITDKDECMALNVGETYKGHPEGSLFAHSLRDVYPFEAYVMNPSLQFMPRQIFYISDGSTEIEGLVADTDIRVESIGDEIVCYGLADGDVIDIWTADGIHLDRGIADTDTYRSQWPHSAMLVVTVSRHGNSIKSFKLIR